MIALAPSLDLATRAMASLPGWDILVEPSPNRREFLAYEATAAGDMVIMLRDRRQAGGDNAFHGPREWAEDGGLGGVFGDHQSRYKWAASQLPANAVVLDCPSGTGYGSAYLGPKAMVYHGLDVDTEAVCAATTQYRLPRGGGFQVGSMLDIPFAAKTFSHIVSFEGFEHVEDHAQVAKEFARVLVPRGTLFLSTPVRGVAHGTAWDKYMVIPPELKGYLQSAGFTLEWFSQANYGVPTDVVPGYPPQTHLIQVVRATLS